MKKILLVDEHEIFKMGFNLILKNEGSFELVSYARNKADAMVAMQKTNPDLVIIDILLKDADGFNICRDITNKYPKTKVVILTGIDDNEFRLDAKEAGASGYFVKNINSEDFIKSIKIIVNKNNLYLIKKRPFNIAKYKKNNHALHNII